MPKKFIKSFKYARAGIEHAMRTQRNLWIHLGIGGIVLGVAFFLRVGLLEFSILTLTISFVLVTEMVNTAIEELVNILSPEHKVAAKLAKDVAAAAVLLAALGSVLVGALIFLPKFLAWFNYA
ncbi:MAG: diacylglycerol kinase family protein [Candidatus Margulisiibacteriota bacterium]